MIIRGFKPRPSQRAIFESPKRILVVDAGRRWGKTITGLNWALEGVARDRGLIFWIAPTYSQSRMVYRILLQAARAGTAKRAILSNSDSELRVEFLNRAVIEFKTGDNPDNLRGAGLTRVILDEAARLKREIFFEVIRPAISDTGGRVLLLSTPKGKNYFYELFLRGQDPQDPDIQSWKSPTSDNPKVPAADLDLARQLLPPDVYAQEYEAEFLENTAAVFRRIREAIKHPARNLEEPNPDREYYAGLDLARLADFSVLTIIDDQGRQVYFDRFNILDWAVQIRRVAEPVRRFQARLVVDSTGVGDPIYEELRRADLAVEGYKFTSQSKKQLIEALQLGFEQGRLELQDIPAQTNELENFEYSLGREGLVHYSAPEGYHDDCVIALALAFWNIRPGRQQPAIYL